GAPAQRQRTDFLRRTEPGVLEGRGRGASNLLETAADPRAELRAIVAGGKLRSGCERRRRARCDANALQTIRVLIHGESRVDGRRQEGSNEALRVASVAALWRQLACGAEGIERFLGALLH